MKIEIDLQDILGSEFGDMESLSESIHRQVVDNLTDRISKGVLKKVDESIGNLIDKKVEEFAEKQLPDLFKSVIDAEYDIVDSWGSIKETTTMRKKLINTLTSQMVYKKCNYESDKNYFTKNVDAVLAVQTAEFQKNFDNKITEVFTKEAFEYAIIKMKQTLKID